MKILGISAFYHDSAAAIIEDGKIIAAAQEERFTRKKHDESFPRNAIQFCLEEAKIQVTDLDFVTFYEKPFLKFERLLETYMTFAPRGFASFRRAMPLWLKEKLFQKQVILDAFKREFSSLSAEKILFSEHHLSHAASAFYPSPYNEAVILTMDGVGEWTTSSVCIGRGNKISIEKEIHFPDSLGLLYSAFTYYLGFKVNSGEYKLMGLAPYGRPTFTDQIYKHLVDVKADGSYRLNQKFFNYCTGLEMTSRHFHELFGQLPRKPGEPLTQKHMDIAASIQAVTEDIVLRICRNLAEEYKIPNLCLAGGVALNCVANGKLLKSASFANIWIQPAAGDAGGALGAALAAHHLYLNAPRKPEPMDSMQGAYLGPSFSQSEIELRLKAAGAVYTVLEEDELYDVCAELLCQKKALGWFQGRMEFGPRALGARSILADPRCPEMQSTLNLKVKYRESFRPFAPAILREHVSEWFNLDGDSPYMLMVADVTEDKRVSENDQNLSGIEKLKFSRSEIPAVTHVDFSARVQTVEERTNAPYYQLLKEFHKRTGCPILVNTSFNVRGEPIVCTPEDAFRCFMGTEIEALVVGRCLLLKDQQNAAYKLNYKEAFELD